MLLQASSNKAYICSKYAKIFGIQAGLKNEGA
jgi:hypothetical protein